MMTEAVWQVIWEELWRHKLALESAIRAIEPIAEVQRLMAENARLRAELQPIAPVLAERDAVACEGT